MGSNVVTNSHEERELAWLVDMGNRIGRTDVVGIAGQSGTNRKEDAAQGDAVEVFVKVTNQGTKTFVLKRLRRHNMPVEHRTNLGTEQAARAHADEVWRIG